MVNDLRLRNVSSNPDVRRARTLVVLVAMGATAFKLFVAATTVGTNDVLSWADFARGVSEYGWTGMYGGEYVSQYNHPPLAGVWLLTINWLVEHHLADLPFLIRLPAAVADAVTALLVFEMVRVRRPVQQAVVAAGLICLSPALLTISGFHGNTDPVFVMLALLAVYLVTRDMPFPAGAAFGLAVSVKLVPVVIGPVLLVYVLRTGWKRACLLGLGVAVVMVPLWLPALLSAWPELRSDVLSYAGSPTQRQWGLPQFVAWAGGRASWSDALAGPGRAVVVGLSGLVPAVLVWRRPHLVDVGAATSLAMFLLLTPQFGMQYLSWAIAAAYLVNVIAGSLYNLTASVFVLVVYGSWASTYPWNWDLLWGTAFTRVGLASMVATWLSLALVVGLGMRQLTGAATSAGRSCSTRSTTCAASTYGSAAVMR
jgi:hypothetical protein